MYIILKSQTNKLYRSDSRSCHKHFFVLLLFEYFAVCSPTFNYKVDLNGFSWVFPIETQSQSYISSFYVNKGIIDLSEICIFFLHFTFKVDTSFLF